MGREISQVMGHRGAAWLERESREVEERTDLLLEAIRIIPGDRVGDIGAGTGYFTWRIAKRVGDTGLVYANEIQPEMLEILTRQIELRGVEDRVKPILGELTHPRLPEASCDIILLVDVYHEFSHPFEMTRGMIEGLKTGGRLVLVEYRLEDPTVPIKRLHKMSEAQVKLEMGVHPELEFVENIDVLPRQHILVFRKIAE